MYNKKNKKGVSPLIATVLIIGFTIVLAALVITWGTKLFKGTVADTEASSKFNLACTTDLNLEVLATPFGPSGTQDSSVNITLRNNKQERKIDNFLFLIHDVNNLVKNSDVSAEAVFSATVGTNDLVFPIPKTYNITAKGILPANLKKVEIFARFNIDGVTKACSSPTIVNLK